MAKRTTKKIWHYHGCVQCHERYNDACDTPGVNGTCSFCRNGSGFIDSFLGQLPRDCCVATSQLVTDKEVRTRYLLRGESPWWQCRECKRTQIYEPATKGAIHDRERGGLPATWRGSGVQ